MNLSKFLITIFTVLILMTSLNSYSQYKMPEETSKHEGTWLQWPHHYTYGMSYRNSLDETWVKMTEALIGSEKVHIIAYNTTEKSRITTLLNNAGISLTNVDFFIFQYDDVWIRDNGPMFVYDTNNDLKIIDWGFNGWGDDAPYSKCDVIPTLLANNLSIPAIDLSAMVLEGGAIEIDGNGTLMATRSSVTHSSRNPSLTEAQIENYITTNMGVTNFIWLDGVYGIELTDMHIDGFMKFANENTIITMNTADLQYWELPQTDIDKLYAAKNKDGEAYNFIYIPLTQNDVVTLAGKDLGYKGSYCNYYIANSAVLVPNYNDPNDAVANAIIQNIYPNRTVIGIDVRNLYENGGMIHCVTQQQPVSLNTSSIKTIKTINNKFGKLYPNPVKENSNYEFKLKNNSNVAINIFDMSGKRVKSINSKKYFKGTNNIEINTNNLKDGMYTYVVLINNIVIENSKMIVKR